MKKILIKEFQKKNKKINIKEFKKIARVTESRIKQKCEKDEQEQNLRKKLRKKGGQPGNKNAAGKTPAKNRNKNAVTHGAFVKVEWKDISPEQAKEIRNITILGMLPHMMQEELQALYLRKTYLENLLKKYEILNTEEFCTNTIVHMIVPKNGEEMMDSETSIQRDENVKTTMKTIVKSSTFNRVMKIEEELNKLHGRIIKQLDSMKAYEMENRRLQLEEQRVYLLKQKITGEIDINPEED